MIPQILIDIQSFVSKQSLELYMGHSDGRANSLTDEDIIIKSLVEEFGDIIVVPPPRYWYDFAVSIDNKFYPVNVKTTTMKTPDNVSAKLPLLWSFTDLDSETIENGKGISKNKNAIKYLIDNKGNLNRDYYFLVVNKTDTSDVIINGLKGLSVLSPNPSNPPFQVRWDKNRIYNKKSFDKSYSLVMGTWKSAIQKKFVQFEQLLSADF
jgi:hypothetical protein